VIGPEPSPPGEIKPIGTATPLPNLSAEISFVKRGAA
jgi:hypothetical protein